MRKSLRLKGQVVLKDGAVELSFDNMAYVNHHLRQFKPNEFVTVTIESLKRGRTAKQNDLYWLYLEKIAQYTGYSSEELHEYCKFRFLPHKWVSLLGHSINSVPSTSLLQVGEFVEYLMKIERFAAELGVKLPNPNDYEGPEVINHAYE